MPESHVVTQLPTSPENAWAILSDMSRFEDWMTIHDKWNTEVPAQIAVGTKVTEQLTIMGMTNKIEWTVEEYNPPKSLKISGTGLAGAQISFTLSVADGADAASSEVTIDAEFTGQMMVGAIGAAVEKNAAVELDKSLAKLAELVG
jgi:carbon monoxide dehydrogenase subunit G